MNSMYDVATLHVTSFVVFFLYGLLAYSYVFIFHFCQSLTVISYNEIRIHVWITEQDYRMWHRSSGKASV